MSHSPQIPASHLPKMHPSLLAVHVHYFRPVRLLAMQAHVKVVRHFFYFVIRHQMLLG